MASHSWLGVSGARGAEGAPGVPGRPETGLSTRMREAVSTEGVSGEPKMRWHGRVCWGPTSEEERGQGGDGGRAQLGGGVQRSSQEGRQGRRAVLSGDKSTSLCVCFSIVPTV